MTNILIYFLQKTVAQAQEETTEGGPRGPRGRGPPGGGPGGRRPGGRPPQRPDDAASIGKVLKKCPT